MVRSTGIQWYTELSGKRKGKKWRSAHWAAVHVWISWNSWYNDCKLHIFYNVYKYIYIYCLCFHMNTLYTYIHIILYTYLCGVLRMFFCFVKSACSATFRYLDKNIIINKCICICLIMKWLQTEVDCLQMEHCHSKQLELSLTNPQGSLHKQIQEFQTARNAMVISHIFLLNRCSLFFQFSFR